MISQIAFELKHLLTIFFSHTLPYRIFATHISYGSYFVVKSHSGWVVRLCFNDKDEISDSRAPRHERLTVSRVKFVFDTKFTRLRKVSDNNYVQVFYSVP